MAATRFAQPMRYSGDYINGYWAGFRFKDPLGYTTGYHTGVDYNYGAGADDLGEPVRAIASGTVAYSADRSDAFGKTIILKHTLSPELAKKFNCPVLYSRYLHLNRRAVAQGQAVKLGQIIGEVGKTGTTSPHLHLDLWKSSVHGVHLQYHKSNLTGYLDPFKTIEANKEAINMPTLATRSDVDKIFISIRGRMPNEHDYETSVGKDLHDVLTGQYNSNQAIAYRARIKAALDLYNNPQTPGVTRQAVIDYILAKLG